MIQSTEWERLAMLQMSSISLVEYNDTGGPDLDDPYNALIGDTASCKGMTVESLDGGTVRYFRSNSGGKIETLVNNRPGNPFLDFHNRLLKGAFAGLNWPMALYEGHAAGGGTAQRTEIAMAQRSVEDRQDLLFYAAKRLCGYAIAKAMKRGDLPQSPDWYQWEFSTPPKLTIDDGRITKELEALWKMGAANMRDIGYHFPDTSGEFKNIDSKILLQRTVNLLSDAGWQIGNIDCTLVLEKPKIMPHVDAMKAAISEHASIAIDTISIKATTNEKLGFIGREEGVVAHAVALIHR
jgi:2-C-methyl-D-erythritol 2,4-cyclodiphosphate synthase